MIRVVRCAEPPALAGVRTTQLGVLRALGRAPLSDEIKGYRVVSEDLWEMQHYKCCYCEEEVQKSYNDVEHYRPKARADRTPGSNQTHGYWWLAFDWENLLFACPLCNRTGKNDLFPLQQGSMPLMAEDLPPGQEKPWLLNPAGSLNPSEHICFAPVALRPGQTFRFWRALPWKGSLYADYTIRVCGLNHEELCLLRGNHVDKSVQPCASELNDALRQGTKREVETALRWARRLFRPSSKFSLLSYDALQELVDKKALTRRGYQWPDRGRLPL